MSKNEEKLKAKVEKARAKAAKAEAKAKKKQAKRTGKGSGHREDSWLRRFLHEGLIQLIIKVIAGLIVAYLVWWFGIRK